MPTRLKQLELHGFKSFATPTTFVFDPGITAVIGPNGSGKSNIADAVRWVLGEQSYSSLRGRKTEDVIFAGGSNRAPLGMAEVSLTLDNASGELPLAFAEITVVRRAFRSGENQYLINGSRVRLKDVLQITALLGQAYTVIGQGLVDAVLSQQPEDRRGLFEHAAGITGLRLKRSEAERSLNETRTNVTRLEDLLREIEPRLRTLERAARQAREYDEVAGKLHDARRALATFDYQTANAKLLPARESLAALDAATSRLDQEIAAASRGLQSADAAVKTSEMELNDARQEAGRHENECREAAHQLAIERERLSARQQRADDSSQSLADLKAEVEAIGSELGAANQAAEQARNQLAEVTTAVAAAEQQASEERQKRSKLTAELHAVEQRVDQAEREEIAREARQQALQQQHDDLEAEAGQLCDAARSRRAQLGQLRDETERCAAERASLDAGLIALDQALERLDRELATARQAADEYREPIERLRRRLAEKRARLEALERLRDSGAGLQAGASMILQAAQSGELTGIVGTIARLIVVPAELETAIEVGLGARLQDIVTERWRDAERAVELLKQRRSGRATFQPLDTIRSSPNRGKAPTDQPGILGIAAALISFDPRIEPVIQGVLGRTLVAQDLPATRKVLSTLPSGWTVVTLAGEIVRSNGSLTGGAQVRESGTLAREREFRQLPKECEETQRQLDRAISDRKIQLDQITALEAQRATEQARRSEAAEASREAESRLGRLTHRQRDIAQQIEEDERRRKVNDDRLAAAGRESGELDRLAGDLRMRIEQLTARRRELAEALSHEFDQSRTDALQELRTRRAGVAERARSADEQCRRLGKRRQEAASSLADLKQRLASVERETAAAQQAATNWQNRLARLQEGSQQLESRIAELSDTHRRMAADREVALAESKNLDARRQSLGSERDRRWLELERLQDDLKLVIERAAHDLGDDDGGDIANQLASGEVASSDEASKLGPRIERLRDRLRRIGLAGEGAVEAFEQESERYRFLRAQLDDVEQAARTLRLMLEDLDRAMRQEFDRAFAQVASEFEAMFQKLFGGGKARLIQTNDDGLQTGIDILAQPPGKRLQNLSLLSGGERSLTAVALLFAIQKVNPSPFCLLDEVDAALDEANVVRLGAELRTLSENTQFVVITHNRATIEGADTLYGVSIGADSVSRVLSLRLEGREEADAQAG